MVGKLLVLGMLAGLFAGLFTFSYVKVYGEPWIDRAIAFEESADAAKGIAAEPELVSRETQASYGLLTGVLVYGVAVGGLFALAFAFANGRLGRIDPRTLSLLLAVGGFITIILVPALKYPPNPPAVGSGETIAARTELYFMMLLFSLFATTSAVLLARWLSTKMNGWDACLLASFAYIATIALVFFGLPSVNEVPDGFAADILWNFRMASLSGQAIFWIALGVGFGFVQQGLSSAGDTAKLSRRTA